MEEMEVIPEHGEPAWGKMEEEQEVDKKIVPIDDGAPLDSPSTRVRFHNIRTVVRYPSEQSLQEDGLSGEQKLDGSDEERVEEVYREEVKVVVEKTVVVADNHVNGILHKPADVSNENSSTTQEGSTTAVPQDGNKPAGSRWFDRVQIKRYTPKYTPPPPKPEEEEESEDEDEYEDDEDGYDSVVEEDGEGAEPAEDPIKKIAEETLVSRKAKLQSIASEQEKMLDDITQIKTQLRDEVEKSEQASKAAAQAAARAEEEAKVLSSRVSNMRSWYTTLCEGC